MRRADSINLRGEAKTLETQKPARGGTFVRQSWPSRRGKNRFLAVPIFPQKLNRCKPFLATAKLCPNRHALPAGSSTRTEELCLLNQRLTPNKARFLTPVLCPPPTGHGAIACRR